VSLFFIPITRKPVFSLAFATTLLAMAGGVSAATLSVGPGKSYVAPCAAIAAAMSVAAMLGTDAVFADDLQRLLGRDCRAELRAGALKMRVAHERPPEGMPIDSKDRASVVPAR